MAAFRKSGHFLVLFDHPIGADERQRRLGLSVPDINVTCVYDKLRIWYREAMAGGCPRSSRPERVQLEGEMLLAYGGEINL
jgi:hypothetical protein